MNCLYVVAVPIGNLEEITILGKKTLSSVGTIFCEDTRVTKKLLSLLEIDNGQNLIKLNQFNESESVDLIISHLRKESCALVSDAGYPVISDPGYFLISHLRKRNIPIQVVNGPCAFVHAIVTSGIDSRKIFFASFLTKKYLQRKKEFESFKSLLKETTIVYYETKNFLVRGLEIMREVLGDIEIGVGRELTKLNETFYYGKISDVLQEIVVKGEFVVIIPRSKDCFSCSSLNIEEVISKVHEDILETGRKVKDVCRDYVSDSYSLKEIYSAYIKKYRQ